MATIKLIGDAPNQVSRNKDLGSMAHVDIEEANGYIVDAAPSATTPLDGTEELAVVQAGDTKKTSVADLTANRVTSVSRVVATGGLGTPSYNAQFGWVASQGAVIAGVGSIYDVLLQNKTNQSVLGIVTGTRDAEMTAGNLRFSSGKGIDFSADGSAAGMTSELLDDYEEGTWTPEITFFTPGDLAVAYSSQVGIYTKVGRIVTLIGCITTSSFTHTTASGNFLISGMPFTSANVAGLLTNGSVTAQGWTKAGYAWLSPQIQNNATSIYFQTQNSGSSIANVTVADIPTATTQVWRFAVTYFV